MLEKKRSFASLASVSSTNGNGAANGEAGLTVEVFHRVVLMGTGAVGKSSLTNRFVSDTYTGSDSEYDPTIEDRYQVTIDDGPGPKRRIEVVDTGGQEGYYMYEDYYKTGNGFMFVYDITSEGSLEELETKFFHDLRQRAPQPKGRPVVIVGNKCDLADRRQVETKAGQMLALRHHCCGFYEVSAKTGENVHEAFGQLLDYLKTHPPGRSLSSFSGCTASDRSSSDAVRALAKDGDVTKFGTKKCLPCVVM